MNSIKKMVCDKYGILKRTLWIEWKHKNIGFTHCKDCLKLDGCRFRDDKKPTLPRHHNCHCYKTYIDEPQADKNVKAVFPIAKFASYVFGQRGIENGKKKLFESFGFTKEDAADMQNEYERQAAEKYARGEYELGVLNEHGQRINIIIEFFKNGKPIKIKSGWMVRPQGLITNNTPYAGR